MVVYQQIIALILLFWESECTDDDCYYLSHLWKFITYQDMVHLRPKAIYAKRQYGICWLKKELSMVHGTLHICFRIKTFFCVKIENWNFQQLFDLGFRETFQNFSSFRQTFLQHFSMGIKSWLNELKFC